MNEIVLPYPPSANRYWRHYQNRVVLSQEAKDYKNAVGWVCRAEGVALLNGAVVIEIDAYRPRKSGDLDNLAKVALDALQGYLYDNDNQIIDLHMRRYDDKKNPRLEVRWYSGPEKKAARND